MAVWRAFSFYLAPIALVAAFVAIVAFMAGGGRSVNTLGNTGQTTLPTGILVQPGAIIGGQALRIGEAITPGTSPVTTPVGGLQRPVGSFVYARDGATGFVKTGSAPTAWSDVGALGGNGTTSDSLTSRAKLILGATNLSCNHEDFLTQSSAIYAFIGVGSGLQALDTAATGLGGWIRVLSGATASSRGRFTAFGALYGNIQTTPFYFAVRFRINGAVDAQTQIMLGISDGTPTRGLGVGLCGAFSSTQYVLNSDMTAGGCTGSQTGSGITTLTTAHLWEFWGVGTGSATAAVDGAIVTTTLPLTVSAVPMRALYIDVLNGTTAVSREVAVDYFHNCWTDGP